MKLDCHLRIVMRSSRIGTGKDDHLIQYSDNYAAKASALCYVRISAIGFIKQSSGAMQEKTSLLFPIPML